MSLGPPPPREGFPTWLRAILIVAGVLVGLFVLLFGACMLLLSGSVGFGI